MKKQTAGEEFQKSSPGKRSIVSPITRKCLLSSPHTPRWHLPAHYINVFYLENNKVIIEFQLNLIIILVIIKNNNNSLNWLRKPFHVYGHVTLNVLLVIVGFYNIYFNFNKTVRSFLTRLHFSHISDMVLRYLLDAKFHYIQLVSSDVLDM